MTDLADYGTAVIRTAVPGAVGAVAAWGAVHGVGVPDSAQTGATALLTFAALSAYYSAVHALELKYPKIGVLLGVPKRPVYTGLAPGNRAAGVHQLDATGDDVPDLPADEPDPGLRA